MTCTLLECNTCIWCWIDVRCRYQSAFSSRFISSLCNCSGDRVLLGFCIVMLPVSVLLFVWSSVLFFSKHYPYVLFYLFIYIFIISSAYWFFFSVVFNLYVLYVFFRHFWLFWCLIFNCYHFRSCLVNLIDFVHWFCLEGSLIWDLGL